MDSNELEKENLKLREELAWIHTLMRNDTIQPREKVVLYEAKYELSLSRRDENGIARIFVWKIADETGVSERGVGKSLQLLSEHGIVERRVGYVTNEVTGQGEKAIYLGLTDVARNPSKISLPATTRGGKRTTKLCPSCGHNEHIEHKKHICVLCGTVFDETWKTVTETEEEGETDV